VTREEMLCAVAYMLGREADAVYYSLERTEEEVERANYQCALADKIAADAGADNTGRWQKAVEWVTNP